MNDRTDPIAADLIALADDSARGLPAPGTVTAHLAATSDPYRDAEPGAEARRRALFETRLRELALLPAAFERVFVHRVSRAAAGATALAAFGVAVVASMDLWTQRVVFAFFGQPTAPLVAALMTCAALIAYVVAGLIAERYYEHRVRAAVEPREPREPAVGVFDDIDRLEAAAPLDESRRLLDGVDRWSVALPIAGTIAGGLLLGLLVYFADHGYSAIALVATSRAPLMMAALLGLSAAIFIGHACARDRRVPNGSTLVRLGSHWLTLAAGAVALMFMMWLAARTAFGLRVFGIMPSYAKAMMLGCAGGAALLIPSVWMVLWQRRREHHRLGEPMS